MVEIPPSPRHPKAHLRALASVLAFAIVSWGLLQFNPLDLERVSRRRSDELAARLSAARYLASNRVTVVLVDDAYLDRIGSSWPPSYASQGRLLRQLVGHAPRAVFVDVLYSHRHATGAAAAVGARAGDGPEDLVAPVARDRAVPIYLPQLVQERASGICPSRPGRPRGEEVVDRSGVIAPFRESDRFRWGVVGWWGCGERYPLYLADDAALARTPAFALFSDDCAGPSPLSPGACAGLRAGAGGAIADPGGRFRDPMIVRWGAFPPSGQRPFYTAGVCQRGAEDAGGNERVPALARARASLNEALLGLFSDLRDEKDVELRRPCPAVNVLPATALLDYPGEAVDELLRGRFVLLGTKLAGVPDWYQSPVHGQVPGVVLHAMALDNLLQGGDRYPRAARPETARMWSLALLVGVAVLHWLLRDKRSGERVVWRLWATLRSTWAGPAASAPGDSWRAVWNKLVPAVGLGCWGILALFHALAGMYGRALLCAALGLAFDLLRPHETARQAMLVGSLAAAAAFLSSANVNWIGLVLACLSFSSALQDRERSANVFHEHSLIGHELGRHVLRTEAAPPPGVPP